jgi:ABC-type branched-subunit amino acid transport system substrate-binding protein
VCGQQIDCERLPASPTDSNAAKINLLTVLDKKADILAGIPNSATVIALAADIKAGGTPIILSSSSVGTFVGAPNSIGSEWGFIVRPRNASLAASQAEYMVKDLGKKKIGLVWATQPFGVQSCDAAKPVVEQSGGQVVSRQDTGVAATNLTTQVLAMKNAGVDGVLAFQFPNVVVVLFNQAAEIGLNVPILAEASAGLAVATKNVKADTLKLAYGLDDCAPATETRAKGFAAEYKSKFNAEAGYASAQAYDTVCIFAAAIKKQARSTRRRSPTLFDRPTTRAPAMTTRSIPVKVFTTAPSSRRSACRACPRSRERWRFPRLPAEADPRGVPADACRITCKARGGRAFSRGERER